VRRQPDAGPATIPGSLPWRLSRNGRRCFLVTHIAAGGAWLGLDVAMGVLVFVALTADRPSTRVLCYQALNLVAVWPLLAVGLLSLASGVVLAWGSKYGLLRYWWVAIKLALNIALTGLVPLALQPTVLDAVERANTYAATGAGDLSVGNLVFPPIVSPAALLVAMVLSVFKPWGRISRRRTDLRRDRA
jgi:hypothetical protein